MLLLLQNYDAILYLVLATMTGPSIVLAITGLAIRQKHKKAAKVLFILAVVYLIVSFGICGSMIL